jgi:hypothetical protein
MDDVRDDDMDDDMDLFGMDDDLADDLDLSLPSAGARSGTKDRDSLRYSMDSNISDSDDIFGRLDVMRVRHARSTIAPKARDTFDRRTVEGLDITDECVERLLDLFDDKLNADHDGQVDITQFLANLGIAADPFSHRMFSLVDTGHSFGVTPNE